LYIFNYNFLIIRFWTMSNALLDPTFALCTLCWSINHLIQGVKLLAILFIK
jgi:hypothetical protein